MEDHHINQLNCLWKKIRNGPVTNDTSILYQRLLGNSKYLDRGTSKSMITAVISQYINENFNYTTGIYNSNEYSKEQYNRMYQYLQEYSKKGWLNNNPITKGHRTTCKCYLCK